MSRSQTRRSRGMESSGSQPSNIGIRLSKSSRASILQKKVAPLAGCRLAALCDLPKLKEMIQHQTRSVFGTRDIESILNKSYASLVLENINKEIVGAIFTNNFPNLPCIPQTSWTSWLKNKYRIKQVTTRNCLFISMALFNMSYSRQFFNPLLEKLFLLFTNVKYVIMIIPPHSKFVDWLSENGTLVYPMDVQILQPQTLMVYLRHNFVNSYKMRIAVVEDNDDLVPLIDSHSKRLQHVYGSYYIAELVATQDKQNRHVILSEFKGQAVGVMIFNDNLNYKLLNECFQLECFQGLKKPDLSDNKGFSGLECNIKQSRLGLEASGRLSLGRSVSYMSTMTGGLSMMEIEEEEEGEEEESVDWNDLNNRADLISIPTGSRTSLLSTNIIDAEEGRSSISEEEEEEEEEEDEVEIDFMENFSCHQLHFSDKRLSKRMKASGVSMYSQKSSCVGGAVVYPQYFGEENAFTLEVIAAWPDHEQCLFQLLQAGFELFPDRDYCVVCTPSSAPHFTLLSKTLVRVSPRPASSYQHELYVVHRNAISCDIWVRRAHDKDVAWVRDFLMDMRHGQAIYMQFTRGVYLKHDYYQAYVIFSDDQLIGVVNLKDMDNLEYIISHYQLLRLTDINCHKPGCYGQIIHFVISPIFQRHTKFLLQEIHRLSEYSLLLHLLYPEDTAFGPYKKDALASVLGDLIPVLPCKMPEYVKSSDTWALPESVARVEKPYAVYLSMPIYCGMSTVEINHKIVVVGASEVGLAFLIHLIFNNNRRIKINFTNITVVSTHGISRYQSGRIKEILIPSTSEITSGYYLAMISLSTYVNVIKGVMSAIDRKNRRITVNSSYLHYDMLFLCCGTQYQVPVRSEQRGKIFERPVNVFVVNTADDVDVAMLSLKDLLKEERKGNVIIYGNCIESMCCVEAMITFGVDKIVYVESPYTRDPSNSPVFDDDEVEHAVKEEIKTAGVKMYQGYTFIDWTYDHGLARVVSIEFESHTRILELPCLAAFMYGKKKISDRTFRAINRANLIFDGALVIDRDFRTNDPHIYAAGSMTKYPRRFYADHMNHQYFNQSEIGEAMARTVLKKLMPDYDWSGGDSRTSKCTDIDGKMLVPRYSQPVRVYAKIPHKVEYLSVRKPGHHIPIDINISDHHGHILQSGSCKDLNNQGFFKLHLNRYNTVETILAISKMPIAKVNLTHIWGKHEALLNNLVQRYEMVLIKDLFDFFSKPWIYALYHDRYEELNTELNNQLSSLAERKGESVIEDVVGKLKENQFKMLTKEQHKEIFDKFLHSGYHKLMEKKVLDFLTENFAYLPMYGTPTVINMILGAYEQSPLFKRL